MEKLNKKQLKHKIIESQKQRKVKNDPQNQMYLFAYNLVQSIGWYASFYTFGLISAHRLAMLLSLAKHYITGGTVATAYESIASLLLFFQSIAAVELVHSISGVFSLRSQP